MRSKRDALHRAAGKDDPSGFSRSDAWVLAAVVYAGGQSGLSNVVAAADIINHAVLEPEELAGALARLSSCGLLERTGDGVRAVGVTDELVSSLHGKRVRLDALLGKCARLLASVSAPPHAGIEASRVSEAAAAVEAYLAMARDALDRMKKS